VSFAAAVIFTLKFSASRFDVFDLDAYGCPWGLLYRVLERAGAWPSPVHRSAAWVSSVRDAGSRRR